ncbi:hypothetical protein TSOC_002095 [Tetrabaena socialis]|uniref:DNA (cytosine-5-)-methyltransferase n=1 Tax=Tetrabaena socialis TaxID=47790 RepID=A0A2J8AF21_9CHLO|nr:hypothetical protein TSOC_002095 [Tetrabaena socialis]|eukprot:PNH11110.1 hypothetical protein TSOC_002095 [Tetrabaena socialis]
MVTLRAELEAKGCYQGSSRPSNGDHGGGGGNKSASSSAAASSERSHRAAPAGCGSSASAGAQKVTAEQWRFVCTHAYDAAFNSLATDAANHNSRTTTDNEGGPPEPKRRRKAASRAGETEWEVLDVLAFRLVHNVKVDKGQTVEELSPKDCWFEFLSRPRLFIWGAAEGYPLPSFPRPEFARVVHQPAGDNQQQDQPPASLAARFVVTNYAGLIRSTTTAGQVSKVFPCQVVGDSISNLEGLSKCCMTVAAQAGRIKYDKQGPNSAAAVLWCFRKHLSEQRLKQRRRIMTQRSKESKRTLAAAEAAAAAAAACEQGSGSSLTCAAGAAARTGSTTPTRRAKLDPITQAAVDREVEEAACMKALELVGADFAALSADQAEGLTLPESLCRVGEELVTEARAAISASLHAAALDLEVVRGLLHKELHGEQESHGRGLGSGVASFTDQGLSGGRDRGPGGGGDSGDDDVEAGNAAKGGQGTSSRYSGRGSGAAGLDGGAAARPGGGEDAAQQQPQTSYHGTGPAALQAPERGGVGAPAGSGAAAPPPATSACRAVPLANHLPLPLPLEQQLRIDCVPKRDGACWMDMPKCTPGHMDEDHVLPAGGAVAIPESLHRLKKAERASAYRRASAQDVSGTICGNSDHRKGNLHYSETRLMSPRECAALQGYPHSFVFVTCFSPFMKHLLNYTGILSRAELLQPVILGLTWLLEIGPAALAGTDCGNSKANTAAGVLHPSKLKAAWQLARRVVKEEHQLIGNGWAQPVTRAMGRCLMLATAQLGRPRTGPSLRQVHVPDPAFHAAWQMAAARGLRSTQAELLGYEEEMQRAGPEEADEQEALAPLMEEQEDSETFELAAMPSEEPEEGEEEGENGEEGTGDGQGDEEEGEESGTDGDAEED